MNDLIQIQNLIHIIRGQRVMLDSDLAMLYETETRTLNQAVKRNIERFPINFMFQLTQDEFQTLISQNVISKNLEEKRGKCNSTKLSQKSPPVEKRGGRQKLPFVFTEQGVAMLSSVLRSKKAIQTNIQIMNTFVQVRHYVLEHKDLTKRFTELEQYFMQYCKDNETDKQKIYEAIDLLMNRTKPSKIGFKTDKNLYAIIPTINCP